MVFSTYGRSPRHAAAEGTTQALIEMRRRRKRAGHELSKMRFVSAQIAAFLKLQLWRTSAERGNRSAAELAERLFEVTVAHEDEEEERALSTFMWQHPVETNQLFLSLPQTARGDAVVAALAGGAPPSPLSAASSCQFYHA